MFEDLFSALLEMGTVPFKLLMSALVLAVFLAVTRNEDRKLWTLVFGLVLGFFLSSFLLSNPSTNSSYMRAVSSVKTFLSWGVGTGKAQFTVSDLLLLSTAVWYVVMPKSRLSKTLKDFKELIFAIALVIVIVAFLPV